MQYVFVLAVAIVVVLGSSLWAAIDSIRIELSSHKTCLAVSPFILFNAMYLLWPILFPLYLITRTRIAKRTIERRRVPSRRSYG
jgi:hypothetical protein